MYIPQATPASLTPSRGMYGTARQVIRFASPSTSFSTSRPRNWRSTVEMEAWRPLLAWVRTMQVLVLEKS